MFYVQNFFFVTSTEGEYSVYDGHKYKLKIRVDEAAANCALPEGRVDKSEHVMHQCGLSGGWEEGGGGLVCACEYIVVPFVTPQKVVLYSMCDQSVQRSKKCDITPERLV